jgi:metallophosphoesterase (TIGR00282 family)
MVKILFIGDIIGSYGRKITETVLPKLKTEHQIDYVIANAENAASGYGLTESVYQELKGIGIDAFTMGNHVWDKREFMPFLDHLPDICRPANFPNSAPGKGFIVMDFKGIKIGIVNLQGRVFMPALDDPFSVGARIVESLKKDGVSIIIVDIHAEATSEKVALGNYLDGKATCVLGTHTHVQTSDERMLPNGTAYLTDLGMVGALDSIIGMDKNAIIDRFLTAMPHRFDVAKKGDGIFNALLLDIDEKTGKAHKINRVNIVVEANKIK